LRLHNNFGETVDAFTCQFAKQTFTRFWSDSTPTFDVTRGVASDLLTGIVFINAWQGTPARETPWYRCFINPHAANPLSNAAIQAFAAPYGQKMRVIKQLEAISVGAATDIRMVNGHCVSSADILKNKTRVRD
jgi:hypothetical protein